MSTRKKQNNKQNKKESLFPLVLIFLAATAVILIIIMTQSLKKNSPEKSTSSIQASEILGTRELIGTKQYSSAPPLLIDPSKKYSAVVTMAKGGVFEIELYTDKAPITVNSFVFLARQGYFDGVTFHRVIDGFMAQGGDPTGVGNGGPGYQFEYEGSDLTFDKAGVVAMANTGPATATNGSQFFITFGPVEQLNGGYTIFGQVVSGMDVVNGLTRRDPQKSPDFEGDVIESIVITEE